MQNMSEPVGILVVDDDASTRMLLRATLSQWGYAVIEAVDGLDALIKLQEPNAPKLVLVDWMMPDLDGFGFCERVKKEIKKPPYVILATSFTGSTQIIKALDAGADEFLAKPFNPAELRSRLRAGLRIINYELNGEYNFNGHSVVDKNMAHCLSDISTELEKALEKFSQNAISCNLEASGTHNELIAELQRIIQLQKKMANAIQSMEKTTGNKNGSAK